jgi:hypothetical protein
MKKMFFLMLAILGLLYIGEINVKAEAATNVLNADSDNIYSASNKNELYVNNGTSYTIDEYDTKLIGINAKYDSYSGKIKVTDDDPIINIIPKSYFTNPGDYELNGKEYFFYISTTYETGYNRIFVQKDILVSRVIIINYENNLEERTNASDIKNNQLTSTMIVKQYVFYTINKNDYDDGYYVKGNLIVANSGSNLIISDDILDDYVVVPNPTLDVDGYNRYYYEANGDYFSIKNTFCQNDIINSHSQNSNEGCFFISAYSVYDASEDIIDNTNKWDTIKENAFSLCEDLIVTGLEAFLGIGTKAHVGIVMLGYTVDTVLCALDNDTHYINVSANNEKEMSEIMLLYTTKDEQIKNYNGLAKTINYSEPNIKLVNNHYIDFKFRYSCDTTDLKNSVINETIGFILCKSDGTQKEIYRTTNYEIYTDDYENVEISQEIKAFNLKNTKYIYTFIPKSTQIYNIELTDGYTFKVYDNKSNLIDINKDKLKSNDTYYIEIYANKTGTYKLKIDYPLIENEINLSYGEEVYLRFNTPTKDVYYVGNKGDSNIIFGFIDGNGITEIKLLDKNENTFIKVYNNKSDIKTFVPNIVEVSESNVYSSYEVLYNGDYSINTNGKYYIYNGTSLEVSNYGTPFFKKGMIIYSKYEFSMELMDYSFYALVNGKYIENHGTCNELYYGDTLENIELYVKYSNGKEEKVDCKPYLDNKKFKSTDGIYKASVLTLIICNIEIDSEDPFFYINPQSILFDYSISGDNVYITANNYNGPVNDVEFTIDNDYKINGGLNTHDYILDESKSVTLDRHELITWAKGYDVKLNIYVKANSKGDIKTIYNSSLKLDIYTSIGSFDYNNIYDTYMSVISRIEFKDGYYQIDDELKFLAFILEYEENHWISFDDGINSDPYFIANAQIHCVKITRDLYFDGFTINNHNDVYLYGYINGNNNTIYGLNFSNPYMYVENYGSIENITIKDTNLKSVFYYNGDYGYTSNVNVEEA